jgi:hypothetical protein
MSEASDAMEHRKQCTVRVDDHCKMAWEITVLHGAPDQLRIGVDTSGS